MTLTNEQLDKLAALERVAEAEPWECKKGNLHEHCDFYVAHHGVAIWDLEGCAEEKDAAFIAAARNAFRSLIEQAREANRLRAEQSTPCAICQVNQLSAVGDAHCVVCERDEEIERLKSEIRKLRGEPESIGQRIINSLREFCDHLESGKPIEERFRVTTIRRES